MVEQAVQTGSLDNLNAKKLLPGGKGTVGVQLNGRPAPPSGKSASGTETLTPWGVLPLLTVHSAAWGLCKRNCTPPKHHVHLQGRPLPHVPWGGATCFRPSFCSGRRLPYYPLLRLRCSSASRCANARAGERREQEAPEEEIR